MPARSLMLRTLMVSAALFACVFLTLSNPAAADDAIARFRATAVSTGYPGPTGIGTVEMVINRWSTDAERERLYTTLLERGPDKLLDVLKDMPRVGYIRTPTSLGYDLHFAQRTPLPDGGERVVIATDRPIGMWEAINRPRTIDYPFTLIEMRVGPNGKGEGKLSLATRITFDREDRTLELENYSSQPVMLTDVRREDLKSK